MLLKKTVDDDLEMAIKYYSILGILNDSDLTQRQVQLIAFTAIKGTISYKAHKQEFCKLFGSSIPTINNMISELTKSNWLVRDPKIKVNPRIIPDFQNKLNLSISIEVKMEESE